MAADAFLDLFHEVEDRRAENETMARWTYAPSERAQAGMISFASDKCATDGQREAYVAEMIRAGADVAALGRCTVQGAVSRRQTVPWEQMPLARQMALLRRFKFHLALERTSAVDWVSRQLIAPLLAGVVPVYGGAPNVDEYLPSPNAIIRASDFANATELAEHLVALSKDPVRYDAHFDWIMDKKSRARMFHLIEPKKRAELACRICTVIGQAKVEPGLLPRRWRVWDKRDGWTSVDVDAAKHAAAAPQATDGDDDGDDDG